MKTITHKTCRVCGATKPVEDFYRRPDARHPRFAIRKAACLECKRAKDREMYQLGDLRAKASKREAARQRRADPSRARAVLAATLKCLFGLKIEDYDRMVFEQQGGCAICGVTPVIVASNGAQGRKWSRLCVDHDHTTGAVRGLLCAACNSGIGWFGDDPKKVTAAAAYLDKHAQQPKE